MSKRASALLVAGKIPHLPAGRHADGAGLFLRITPTRAGSFWSFRYTTKDGQRKELGLGALGEGRDGIGLAAARELASQARSAVWHGDDPRETLRGVATPIAKVVRGAPAHS